MLVNGRDDGSHDGDEGQWRARGLGELVHVEQVDARVRGDREVVVLARAVDVLERFLVVENGQAVPSGHLLADLHEHDVLVDLGGGEAEEGRALVLVGCHLAVAGLHRDAHQEAFVLDLLDALEGNLVGRRHVVVAHLLSTRRVLAHDGAAGHLEVEALVERRARDQEVLLLQPNVREGAPNLVPEILAQAGRLLREGIHRAEQGRLLVERVAVEGDEYAGHVHRVAAQEDRRRRVKHRVATRAVRRADAAVRERRAVRLALEQGFPLELELGLAIGAEGEEGVVHLARHAQAHARRTGRLEPVSVDRCAAVARPLHDGGGDLVRRRGLGGPLRVIHQARRQALLGEVRVGDLTLEQVGAVVIQRRHEATALDERRHGDLAGDGGGRAAGGVAGGGTKHGCLRAQARARAVARQAGELGEDAVSAQQIRKETVQQASAWDTSGYPECLRRKWESRSCLPHVGNSCGAAVVALGGRSAASSAYLSLVGLFEHDKSDCGHVLVVEFANLTQR